MVLLLVFLVGVIAGGMAAIAGSGGLVAIPALILCGLPAEMAIATSRFGSLGIWITATYRFIRGKKVSWRHVRVLAIVVPCGSTIGALLLVEIDKAFLTQIVAALILILLPLSVVGKQMGVVRKKVSARRERCGYFVAFLVAIFAGFFAGGDGTLMMLTIVGFFGLTVTEATATRAVPYFLLCCCSIAVYLSNGLIDFTIGSVLFLGMASGGYLGAHLAIEKGDRWAKTAFVSITAAMALKILFFSN